MFRRVSNRKRGNIAKAMIHCEQTKLLKVCFGIIRLMASVREGRKLYLKVEHYLFLVLGVLTASTVMLQWLSTSLQRYKPKGKSF